LLLDYLDEIERLRAVTVLWSEDLEALLWSDPILPPWRVDRDWRNKLVPVIAKKFRLATAILSLTVRCEGAVFLPPDSLPSVRDDITRAFCRLSHQAALEKQELILCLDGVNETKAPLAIKCGACALDATIRPITSPRNLGRDPEIAAEFWNSARADSVADVDRLLGLALRWRGDNLAARYRPKYSTSFIDKVATAAEKGPIFEALAKRISKTEDEARHDAGLHDEPVRGKEREGIRRFRVSIAERIHYDYPTAQEIRFVDYFPEGHHDDGL
jgi:hypothetical protein